METRSRKRIRINQVRRKDDAYLMHYGVKGQKYGQHDPNRRWQSQAVYANGQPDPDAKERKKSGASNIYDNLKRSAQGISADLKARRDERDAALGRPKMASGKYAKSEKKAAKIDAKVAQTKQKLKDMDKAYKEKVKSGAKTSPAKLAKQQDRAIRKLGKYALKRETGQFANRHAMLIGNLIGSSVGGVGAIYGTYKGNQINKTNFRREGNALLGR